MIVQGGGGQAFPARFSKHLGQTASGVDESRGQAKF